MKIKCENCGEIFEDRYCDMNKLNQRIWCDKCVDIKWEEYNDEERKNDK